ncbi:MAG: hypothetical protein WKF84_05060 [Pyrinomonadaceae bacterium]
MAGSGVRLSRTGNQFELAATQLHFNLAEQEAEKRGIVRAATLEEYKKNPGFAHEGAPEHGKELSMYEPWDYSKGYACGDDN